jgi:hypothetical protein
LNLISSFFIKCGNYLEDRHPIFRECNSCAYISQLSQSPALDPVLGTKKGAWSLLSGRCVHGVPSDTLLSMPALVVLHQSLPRMSRSAARRRPGNRRMPTSLVDCTRRQSDRD